MKNLQKRRVDKKQQEQQQKADLKDQKDRLGVRERLGFGEVVKRPPLNLGRGIQKLKEKKMIAGSNVAKSIAANDNEEMDGPLSTLPVALVAKLSGQNLGKTDVAGVQRDVAMDARRAYLELRARRSAQILTIGKPKQKKEWRKMKAAESVNNSELSFPMSELYNSNSGAKQWVGCGNLFSPESY